MPLWLNGDLSINLIDSLNAYWTGRAVSQGSTWRTRPGTRTGQHSGGHGAAYSARYT